LAGMELSLPIRVLVVDDSAVMRSLLRMVLDAHANIELVGMAQDGTAGLEAMERLNPDLVLLDIEMPSMNGLEVLAEIHARGLRARVIICSTLTRRGAGITLEALAWGAADYVTKPAAQHGVREGIATLSRELLPKILALFPARSGPPLVELRPWSSNARPVQPRIGAPTGSAAPGVLVMGVSTGGPAALEKVLPALPADFPLPVLIVQHMPRLFTALLAKRLDGLCRLSVREAEAGMQMGGGVAHLARGEWHMELTGTPEHCALRLNQGRPEDHCRPSVDVLFRSAASVYGAGVLAVVLTGMGSDGLAGCRAVHAAGGKILVQDPRTSVVWGMPGAVANSGLADQVLPLEAMAGEITRLAMP
jgi:two-component system, chemotaxis family, protein-glutamate methylesterase/glutaminase